VALTFWLRLNVAYRRRRSLTARRRKDRSLVPEAMGVAPRGVRDHLAVPLKRILVY